MAGPLVGREPEREERNGPREAELTYLRGGVIIDVMPDALVIVDGNNVMGSRPDGWWKDRAGAARRLVAQLGVWAAAGERDVLVVFDGAPLDELAALARVEVRFARRRGPDAADDDIAAFVAADATPERLRVVTSDAALARRVRAHGAEVVGARELLDQL